MTTIVCEKRHFLAPYLQNFFMIRLRAQMNASSHTISSYRDTFRMLFDFTEGTLNLSPDKLLLQHLDEALVSNFLDYLESGRGNSIATRNNRLAAIHSFFKYVQNREPDLSYQCQQILNLPPKRSTKKNISFLQKEECTILLESIQQNTWYEKRDYLIILFFIEMGVRVSELTAVKVKDISFGRSASVKIMGKGRKERQLPLIRDFEKILKNWIIQNKMDDSDYIFTKRYKHNFREELSRDNIERIVKKYMVAIQLPKNKNITPHTLRHTFAMRMLKAGNPLPIIALWMGHEDPKTTMVYIHADLEMKRAAVEILSPIVEFDDKKDTEVDMLRDFLQKL